MEEMDPYLKVLTEEAFKYTTKFLAKKIFPLLKGSLKFKKANKKNQEDVEKKLSNFLKATYLQCASIKSLAFNSISKPIGELYIPLTLKGNDNELEIKIDNSVSELEKLGDILIVDSVGMGKSTLTKKIALEYFRARLRIPFYFELRSFQKGQGLFSKFIESLGMDENTYNDLKTELNFVIILDGFDEISLELKEEAVLEINKMKNILSEELFILTSRPDPYLNDLGNFDRFKIKQLDQIEAFKLLQKYDKNGDYSDKIIEGIKLDNSGSFKEFLSTPLYVSLLYCAYKHKPTLPRRKYQFYSQVYEALFESHDLSKKPGFVHEKISRLDSDNFSRVLRKFSYLCLLKNMPQEFLKGELEFYLSTTKENLHGISFEVSGFIYDIVDAVPLFIKEGNKYRWAHKSLFEYFCAMYICYDAKDKQKEILFRLYHSKNVTTYINILELCADIDYSTFKISILKEVFDSFSKYGNNIVQTIKNRKIKKELIIERIGLTFDKQIEIAIISGTKFESFNDILKRIDYKVNISKCLEEGKIHSTHMTIGHFEHPFVIVEYIGINSIIMDFIKDKEPALFRQSINDRSPIKIDGCTIPFDKRHSVNSNSKSIINNKNNYWVVNSMLKYNGGSIPDINKVNEALSENLQNPHSEFDSLLNDFLSK